MSIKHAQIALLLASAIPADASAAHHVIEIKDMAFGAVPKNLKVGDTVEWKNNDIFRHTATARTESFDLDLPPGAHAQVTLRKSGTLNLLPLSSDHGRSPFCFDAMKARDKSSKAGHGSSFSDSSPQNLQLTE